MEDEWCKWFTNNFEKFTERELFYSPQLVQALKEGNIFNETDVNLWNASNMSSSVLFTQVFYKMEYTTDWINKLVKCFQNTNNVRVSTVFQEKFLSLPSLPSYKSESEILAEENGTNCFSDLESGNLPAIKRRRTDNKTLIYTEFLGAGGFGAVLKANDNDNVYAVKVISFESLAKDIAQKEVDILKRLSLTDQNCVVKYLDHWECDSTKDIKHLIRRQKNHFGNTHLRIQMEFCDLSLDKWIYQNRGNPVEQNYLNECLKIFSQIVRGIEFIHNSTPQVIHRDLKPGNILMIHSQNEFIVKIGDFGLARETDNIGTRTYTKRLGTLWYMSPEQKDDGKYNSKTDIYSLGRILYEMHMPRLENEKDYHQRLENEDEEEKFRRNYPFVGTLSTEMTLDKDYRIDTKDLVTVTRYHIDGECDTQKQLDYEGDDESEQLDYKNEESDEDEWNCVHFLKRGKSFKSIHLEDILVDIHGLRGCLSLYHTTITKLELVNVELTNSRDDMIHVPKIYLPNIDEYLFRAKFDEDEFEGSGDIKVFVDDNEKMIKSLFIFKKDHEQDFHDYISSMSEVTIIYNNFTVMDYSRETNELVLPNISYMNRSELLQAVVLVEKLESLLVHGFFLNPNLIPNSLKELTLLDVIFNTTVKLLVQKLSELSVLQELRIRFFERASIDLSALPSTLKFLCLGNVDVLEPTLRLPRLECLIFHYSDIKVLETSPTIFESLKQLCVIGSPNYNPSFRLIRTVLSSPILELLIVQFEDGMGHEDDGKIDNFLKETFDVQRPRGKNFTLTVKDKKIGSTDDNVLKKYLSKWFKETDFYYDFEDDAEDEVEKSNGESDVVMESVL